MASTSPTPSPSGPPDQGAQLELLLGVAQNMLDEESRRTERLETRSRQAFGAAGALFAVVMATTVGILNALAKDTHVHHWVYPLVGITALVSVIALGLALAWTLAVDRARKTDALDPTTIEQYVRPAQKGKAAVATNLINAYARLLRARRANNGDRAKHLKVARVWCGIAALAALCQLGAVFAAVIAR